MLQSFREKFIWGAACSALQVETSFDVDNECLRWWRSPKRVAELEKSGELAKFGGNNFVPREGCLFNLRYRKDFALARELGHNAERISIEPARVIKNGEVDPIGVKHYQEMIRSMVTNGLEPVVTVVHGPMWYGFEWLSPTALKEWEFYVRTVVPALAPLGAHMWISMNEVLMVALQSYLFGNWPPNKKDPELFNRLMNVYAEAHRIVYRVEGDALLIAQLRYHY